MSTAERRRHPRGRPARPRPHRLVLLLGMSALTALVLVLYFTPVLGVRSVRVEGLRATPEQAVLDAAAVPLGEPMLQVDGSAIAERLRGMPQLAGAEVRLEWPSTVALRVTEREPLAYLAAPRGAQLVDAAGVVFRTVPQPPRGLPALRAGADRDASTRSAAQVLSALPPDLRGQVTEVAAERPQDVHLVLTGGRRVHWGAPEQAERKAAILPPLLTREGRIYDVTSPKLPTVA